MLEPIQRLSRLPRLARNLVLDLRYGGRFLGGTTPSAHSALGAHDTANSDYGVLPCLFAGRVTPDDVLVDVGCGRGRVINWWLDQGFSANRIVGLERDRRVAAATRRRLRRYRNVRIVDGDAVDNLPPDGTVFYLFNPFAREVMVRFRDRLRDRIDIHATSARRTPLVIYYNCIHTDVFAGDAHWRIESIAAPAGCHAAAVIRPAAVAARRTLTPPVSAPAGGAPCRGRRERAATS